MASGGTPSGSTVGPSLPPNRPQDGAGVDELMKVAGWDTIPLFMKDLPAELDQSSRVTDTPVNPSIEALQALIYEDDEEGRIQSLEALKARANELFTRREYRQALGFYNQAVTILETPSSGEGPQAESHPVQAENVPVELRNAIYSNRAASHLALGNFRSCLNDCATVLRPPLTVPSTKQVRKCFFRSTKALVALERFDEALDCINKLIAIDRRDQVSDDEPQKLQDQIERSIADRLQQKRDAELVAQRQRIIQTALRAALQSRGILLPSQQSFPPPESSLPQGMEPVRFETIPTGLESTELISSLEQAALVYPVYVYRPKDECPVRDLVLRWHEDDLIGDHLEELCSGKYSHQFYLITSQRRILKCGNKLTIRKISTSISQNKPGDSLPLGDEGNLNLFLLPVGQLEKEWIEETKKSFSQAS